MEPDLRSKERIMFCPSCGSKIADGATFCSSCGKKLVQAPQSPKPDQVAGAPIAGVGSGVHFKVPNISFDPSSVKLTPTRLIPVVLSVLAIVLSFFPVMKTDINVLSATGYSDENAQYLLDKLNIDLSGFQYDDEYRMWNLGAAADVTTNYVALTRNLKSKVADYLDSQGRGHIVSVANPNATDSSPSGAATMASLVWVIGLLGTLAGAWMLLSSGEFRVLEAGSIFLGISGLVAVYMVCPQMESIGEATSFPLVACGFAVAAAVVALVLNRKSE